MNYMVFLFFFFGGLLAITEVIGGCQSLRRSDPLQYINVSVRLDVSIQAIRYMHGSEDTGEIGCSYYKQ